MIIFLFCLFVCFSIFWDDFVCSLAGIVQLICWSGRVLLSFSFNSSNCISGLVLLCFISSSRFLTSQPLTTIWGHNHFNSAFCSFVHAISTEMRAWRHFSFFVEPVFLFICVIKFLVTLDLPLTKMTSSLWNWLLFTLIESDKVKCVCHSKWRLLESS